MKRVYQAKVDHAMPPARVTLYQIMSEQVDIYRYIPPQGQNIPISVEPFPVDNSVPTEDEIKWAVKRIRNHRSWGASGMRAEHIKGGWKRQGRSRRRRRWQHKNQRQKGNW